MQTAKKTAMTTITLACATDANYVKPLAALLNSLLHNLPNTTQLKVYILTEDKNALESHNVLKDIQKNNNIQLIYKTLKLTQADISAIHFGHVTKACLYRLYLPKLLPNTLEKIVYLDCDIIVNADITELAKLDPKQNHVLVAAEQATDTQFVSSPQALPTYKELNIPPQTPFFNTGVMVLNLKLWRKNNIAQKALAYLNKHANNTRWWDQDALNVVLLHKWGELNPKWNVQSELFYNLPWNSGVIKTKAMYKELKNNPAIIHFNTRFKPWHWYSLHPYTFLYRYYAHPNAKHYIVLHKLYQFAVLHTPLSLVLKLLRKSGKLLRS